MDKIYLQEFSPSCWEATNNDGAKGKDKFDALSKYLLRLSRAFMLRSAD
jgi:hypothetical protein